MSITYTLNHGAAADNVSEYTPPSGKQWKSANKPSFALVVGTPVEGEHSECVIPLGGYWTDSGDSSTGADLIFFISNVSPGTPAFAPGMYIDRNCNLHIPQSFIAETAASSIVFLFTILTHSATNPEDYAKPIYVSNSSSAYSGMIENAS